MKDLADRRGWKDAVSGDFYATSPQLVRIETGPKAFYDVPPAIAPWVELREARRRSSTWSMNARTRLV